jgi:hypothetical protein
VNTYKTEGPKTKLIIQEPKTKKSIRKVPLPLDVIKALKEVQKVQNRQREYKGGADSLPDNVIKLRDDENEVNGEDFNIYSHVAPGLKEAAAGRLEGLLQVKKNSFAEEKK